MSKFSSIYRLKRPIGFGGYATVWEAERRDGYPVAIKIHDIQDSSGMLRLADEARILASLDHPHVIRVYDYGETDIGIRGTPAGAPFLVMELADGGTLEEHGWPETWAEASLILDQILQAAAHMHARRVLHRDLKPSNILWVRGPVPQLRIADFGIAHPTDRVARTGVDRATVGTTERPLGTPRYASLEQRLGKWREYGPWTDIYAIGMIAADLVSRPCAEEDPKRLPLPRSAPPVRPRIAVPAEFYEWIASATAARPGNRFASAHTARQHLLAAGAAPAERPTIPGFAGPPRRVGNKGSVSGVDLLDLTGSSLATSPALTLPESGRPLSSFHDPLKLSDRLVGVCVRGGATALAGSAGSGRRRLAMEFGFRLREHDPRATLDLHCRGVWSAAVCAEALELRFRTSGLDGDRLDRRLARVSEEPEHRERLKSLLTRPREFSATDVAATIGSLKAQGLRVVMLHDPGDDPAVLEFADRLGVDVAVIVLGDSNTQIRNRVTLESLGAEARWMWSREQQWPVDWTTRGERLTHGAWLGRARLSAWRQTVDDGPDAFDVDLPELRLWLQSWMPRVQLDSLAWAARRSPSIPAVHLDDDSPLAVRGLRGQLEPAIRHGLLRRADAGWAFEHRDIALGLAPTIVRVAQPTLLERD